MVLRYKSKRFYYFINYSIDILLLAFSFSLTYFIKRRHLYFEQQFIEIIPYFFLSWFLGSVIGKKFRLPETGQFINYIKPYVISALVMSGILSVFLYFFKSYELSRFIIWGTISAFLALEITLLSGFYFIPSVFRLNKIPSGQHFSLALFFIDLVMLGAIFLGFFYYKRGHIILPDEYAILFLGTYLAWGYIALSFHKFSIKNPKDIWTTLQPFVTASLVLMSVLAFVVFAFRVAEFSRFIVLGTILSFAIFETILVSLYYIIRKPGSTDEVQTRFFEAPVLFDPEPEPIEKIIESIQAKGPKHRIDNFDDREAILSHKLEKIYLRDYPEVFGFLQKSLELNIDIRRAEIISSGNPYNIEVLPENEFTFIMNLHEINDFRRINRYLISLNSKLKPGGVFVSRFIPLENRIKVFRAEYPRFIADIFYAFDFIWKRVFPKLPFFQKIYFGITRGRNRVISKAEALGRMYYCGFEIVNTKEIDNYIYFIALKAKEPSTDQNPSYSPLFKMRRIGKNGKDLYVYKFRTMYPYSEYLQAYITYLNGYSENGKIKNDFRTTTWGRFLRKYWLDELPQLINFFKGEMNLVGIRPLSERFLKEYPEDVRAMRMKHKPGCVPPYVALRMQDVEHYIESERIYLLEKQKHPFQTDVKYFFMALFNIVSNKIRSA